MSHTQFSSAVTICLVSQAASGPFVFHNDWQDAVRQAQELGFDAVELFVPDATTIDPAIVKRVLESCSMKLAAVGSGAGWLIHQYSLTSTDSNVRVKAAEFIKRLIDWAGIFKAPVIIGSMQGRHEPNQRDLALERLSLALAELSNHAHDRWGTQLFYEPLNRYETNLFNRLEETCQWLERQGLKNVRVLADLFHMNIEESDLSRALKDNQAWIGHIHWADSNRRAMGWGHTDAKQIGNALGKMDYQGYLSAEVFPLPDGRSAAKQTIESIRSLG